VSTGGGRGLSFVLAAAAIVTITMGVRLSLGLFIAPFEAATAIGIASISFAYAVAQLVWGLSQPVYGLLADRYGTRAVVTTGAILTALGMVLVPFARTPIGLTMCLGIIAAIGAGAGSFTILFAAVAQRIDAVQRGFAAGVINAGSSVGQFLFAPFAQFLIGAAGWSIALWVLAAITLLAIPLGWRVTTDAPAARAKTPDLPLGARLRSVSIDPSYWLLHASFFTCGFHIAFLVTHLPGEVQLCDLAPAVSANSLGLIGLFNIAGSVAAGVLCQRWRMTWLLAAMYFGRALAIALFLVTPRTATSFYVFGAALGVTWLATVPPTAGLIGRLYGIRHLATLFGLTLVSHQVGAFFGAWLGGVAISRFGDYGWMWTADMVLALTAAALSLPIREPRAAMQAARA
jgi:predicted MFS family arabinose efflux permease